MYASDLGCEIWGVGCVICDICNVPRTHNYDPNNANKWNNPNNPDNTNNPDSTRYNELDGREYRRSGRKRRD